MFLAAGRFSLRARRIVAVLAALAVISQLPAADTRPVVGPGASKDDIINAYGWPTGQSQAGAREILSYPQGQVFLNDGKVERVDFSPNVPWPPPRPRPGTPTTSTAKKPAEAPLDLWTERFAEAEEEARRRGVRILALFLGSDWSPGSRQFLEEVAFHPDFVNTFTGDYVFLRLDYPTRIQQLPEIREQNALLRTKYEVTTYPSLLVLSPSGEQVAVVDLLKPRSGATYRANVIEAVNEVRGLLGRLPVAVVEPPPAPAPEKPQEIAHAGAASLTKSFPLVMGAIGGGLALAGIAWWLLWKARMPRNVNVPKFKMSDRIADAASGLPPPAEMMRWPREKLRAVVASLAEANGYQVKTREGGGDGDLALYARGSDRPEIIVCCQPGSNAAAASKRTKELFGIITVEDVKKGWLVAPSGFTDEAHQFVRNRPIVLIDSEHLLAQLRDLPPISLDKIIARDL